VTTHALVPTSDVPGRAVRTRTRWQIEPQGICIAYRRHRMRQVAINEPCLADKVKYTIEEARICSMYLLLPTATMVARKRHNVT